MIYSVSVKLDAVRYIKLWINRSSITNIVEKLHESFGSRRCCTHDTHEDGIYKSIKNPTFFFHHREFDIIEILAVDFFYFSYLSQQIGLECQLSVEELALEVQQSFRSDAVYANEI